MPASSERKWTGYLEAALSVGPLTLFLIEMMEVIDEESNRLNRFINGLIELERCAALAGIEAISNGVQAFKKPESRNAATRRPSSSCAQIAVL
jgi:hypothetical protein